MSNDTDTDRKKPLQLSSRGKLELKKSQESSQVRQQFPHGRAKTVQVEVKRRRTITPTPSPAPAATARQEARSSGPATGPAPGAPAAEASPTVEAAPVQEPVVAEAAPAPAPTAAPAEAPVPAPEPEAVESEPTQSAATQTAPARETPSRAPSRGGATGRTGRGGKGAGGLTDDERANRVLALQNALRDEEERKRNEIENAARRRAEEEARRRREEEEAKQRAEEEERRREEEERRRREEDARRQAEEARRRAEGRPEAAAPEQPAATPTPTRTRATESRDDEDRSARGPKRGKGGATRTPAPTRTGEPRRRGGKMTVTQALDDEGNERTRSMASVRRQRQRERDRLARQNMESSKIVRDVVIPEVITVGELANRMATRGADVIKSLMKMGVMATITQSIDADTAELVATEFGHNVKRVAESDVEIGLKGNDDKATELQSRPPVVTIMGHVDHGKTSLLDALRATDVVSGEAGGITQHIGAYQVQLGDGQKITFIDTPGHAAFSDMRARGANVTDIVVLVVAADDGIMPQTVEAISHAKAAEVPILVAINKCDKPDANPDRVRQELLQHELVVEEMGGDIQTVEVSALKKQGLDKLEEAILLQAEILELKANPNRSAEGVVVEAKLEQGRGSVATVLIQRGTLRIGDIFVTGTEWGRVRALMDDRAQKIEEAGPALPVEVLGLQGTPSAGDDFYVVENEGKARDISAFRQRKAREAIVTTSKRGSLEQMFSKIQAGEAKEFPVVIKSDVQGSVEAIAGSLEKLATDEVKVRVLHQAVGGITESDITLANATGALVVGFNVRANPQAREMAKRDGVDIRYYSIIYQLIDDMKQILSGMLAPTYQENFLGYAEIREVFNITKVGKVAGCMITEGQVKRGSGVRLLRDDVVIHEGKLKTLRRFKDEVREVQQGYECGMAFENYQDIQVGDQIECFEVQEITRTL